MDVAIGRLGVPGVSHCGETLVEMSVKPSDWEYMF